MQSTVRLDAGPRVTRLAHRLMGLAVEFTRRPGAWRALGRNLVAPFGMAAFGWSAPFALLVVYVDAFVLVAAVSFVLAVHVVEEDAPRPWPRGTRAKNGAILLAAWTVGCGVMGLFPFVGGVLLFSAFGATWPSPGALRMSEALPGPLLAIVIMHSHAVVERLRRHDRRAAGREAVDDFRLMLLRAFAFPVAGGMALTVAGLLGRPGEFAVMLALALAMTAGDVFGDEWSEVFEGRRG